MGNVVGAGLGKMSPGNAIGSGLPANIGATTINKVCGSGLKSVMIAAQAIAAGDAAVIVAGGTENMSRHLICWIRHATVIAWEMVN